MARSRNDSGFLGDLGMELAVAILLVGIAIWVVLGLWREGPWERGKTDLPAVISTQQLAGKTIRDDATKRCFTVVQQDGQPRLVPADCPKGK
jgi:hypothetical protein